MKILVLGGTGAMGVPLVKRLAESGNDVYVTTRKSRVSEDNIKYIRGDAHDIDFISDLVKDKFDVIIDFMIYSTDQFLNVINLLLKSTSHYFFFSSSRVYANVENGLIKEGSPRLLDTVDDQEYLKHDEYALAKAREENILFQSGFRNWTIIRPYITFNTNRLQLGVLEKENWLYRALEGKSIIFSDDIASKYTTLTYGEDVSALIADLVYDKNAKGEVFHIATDEYILWKDVLYIYVDAIEKKTGKRPPVHIVPTYEEMSLTGKITYQVKYDRLYNRKFDNSKILSATRCSDFFRKTEDCLRKCIDDFIDSDQDFLNRNWLMEAYFDRISNERTCYRKIPGIKNKIKYFIGRDLPVILMRKILNIL